jgi:hypothetical protein
MLVGRDRPYYGLSEETTRPRRRVRGAHGRGGVSGGSRAGDVSNA